MHIDHSPCYRFTSKSRLHKSINTLVGIIEGITIDALINQREDIYLRQWIADHSEVQHKHPFNELLPVVREALRDRILTGEEKEDILWLCEKLSESSTYYDSVTSGIQKLHAIMTGVVCDGVITEAELEGLSGWLEENGHLKTCWPYDEIESIISMVMEDKIIDKDEQEFLRLFFSDFAPTTVFEAPAWTEGEGRILGAICAMVPEIRIERSLFCFTGASSKYKRSEFAALVESLGGMVTNSVTRKLDYLIIGADGNPCWAYACYGRKVEAAMKLRKEGCRVMLVHEYDFHDTVADLVE